MVRLEPPPTGSLRKEASPFIVVEQSKMLFPLADDTGLIGVGPNVLSSHVRQPYLGWNIFRGRITEALKEYVSIANPTGIRKVVSSANTYCTDSYRARTRRGILTRDHSAVARC